MTANLMFEVGQAKIHDLYDRAERRRAADAVRAAHRAAHRKRRSRGHRVLAIW